MLNAPKSLLVQAVVVTALILLAAGHLMVVRKNRQIVIRGQLQVRSGQPLDRLKVDVCLLFDEIRLRVQPDGLQYVSARRVVPSDAWRLRQDEPADYSMDWQKDGRFQLRLALSSQAPPKHAWLVLRFPGELELKSRPFRLVPQGRERLFFSGRCAPWILESFPRVSEIPASDPLDASGSADLEPPDGEAREMESQQAGIVQLVDFAMLRINSLSTSQLHVRSEALSSYQGEKGERIQRVSLLLAGMLRNRRKYGEIVNFGQKVIVAPATDELEAEEPILSGD